MSKPNSTAIMFLIDRSGSMHSTAKDAIGGMKQFIADQQKVEGDCTLSVAQFDTTYELVHAARDIHHVPAPQLQPRGGTALYDSWGRAMADFKAGIKATPKAERPEHIIFVVITDGGENASQEWTQEKVFAEVTKLTKKGWTFVYLGSNQDAMATGTGLGVAAGSTMTYDNTAIGTFNAYASASTLISNVRSGTGDGTFEGES